ncbi:MAG: FHA domain-containing protein [Planctomycetota bacterium]
MACVIIETDELNKEPCKIILGNESVIGREKANAIYIDDPRASRQHAKITKEPDGSFLLVDMGSRNGIIVNGEKVSRRKLIEKDRIVIGRTTLIYSESEPSSPAKGGAGVQASAAPTQPPPAAETMKMTPDEKTITADPLGDASKLKSDALSAYPLERSVPASVDRGGALQKAIDEVAAAYPPAATDAKKPAQPKPVIPKPSGAKGATAGTSDEVVEEAPSLGKRILVFLTFLIFFIVVLLFAKEATKRLLFKAEKSQETTNIPSSAQPK